MSCWYHPTISSSVTPFSSCPQSFPESGSYQMSQLFISGGQSIGTSASASVLPMNIQGWYLGLTNERQRIDAFELWCWRRVLKSPLDCKEIKTVLKEISPEYSLEGLMPKLKLQYFGHLIWRAGSLEKTPMLGDWWQGGKGGTEDDIVGRHHQLTGHEFGQTPWNSEG